MNRHYIVVKDVHYYSSRYKKAITVKKGFISDGATGAPDIKSFSWLVHDWLYEKKCFDDGTPCSYKQANLILRDILVCEGHKFEAIIWYAAVELFRKLFDYNY